jgi:hypothetical protein
MRLLFRTTSALLDLAREDLRRPHPVALERVGFLACRVAQCYPNGCLVLASRYYPVHDEHYVPSSVCAAVIDSNAIREALQRAYSSSISVFHVHMHDHCGVPFWSRIDAREMTRLMPDFLKVRPELPHGVVVLSRDSLWGYAWHGKPPRGREFTSAQVVGSPLVTVAYDRQI